MHAIRPSPARTGLAMVEVVVCVVIVGIAMAAAMNTVAAAVDLRERSVMQIRGQALADMFLAEILNKKYHETTDWSTGTIAAESGEVSGTKWASFDDIDDFTGRTWTPPADANGTPYPGYESWSLLVQVRWLDDTTFSVNSSTTTGQLRCKRIVVTARHGGRDIAQSVAVRSIGFDAYGGLD
jgi:type II secretory pathway pseudopilin PulG